MKATSGRNKVITIEKTIKSYIREKHIARFNGTY